MSTFYCSLPHIAATFYLGRLAPRILGQAFEQIQQINTDLDVAVLIIEQKVREVLKIANRVYVLRNGLVSFSGTTDLLDDLKLREVYL